MQKNVQIGRAKSSSPFNSALYLLKGNGVFGKLFKKEKPRVYLGTLAVLPRSSFKKIDELGLFHNENLDRSLHDNLKEIFSLPGIESNEEPRPTDLALDVFISNYQSGGELSVSLGEIAFPFYWRPKVEVRTRLYEIKSRNIKSIFSVTEKLPWLRFFSRMLSLRAAFSFKPFFDKHDMEILLYKACQKQLIKLKNKI